MKPSLWEQVLKREAISVLGIDDRTYQDTLGFNATYTPLGDLQKFN